MDGSADQRGAEQYEQTINQRYLQAACEHICAKALATASSAARATQTGFTDLDGTLDTLMWKCTQQQVNDCDVEELQWITSHLEGHSAAEANHKLVENRELEIEKKHNDGHLRVKEMKTVLAEIRPVINSRKFFLDRKRLTFETEERKGLLERECRFLMC